MLIISDYRVSICFDDLLMSSVRIHFIVAKTVALFLQSVMQLATFRARTDGAEVLPLLRQEA